MCIADVERFVVIYFHHSKRLGDLLRFAFFLAVGPIFILVMILGIPTRNNTVIIPRNGSHGGSRTGRLSAIGHERQDQAFQPIYPVLHIVRGIGGILV